MDDKTASLRDIFIDVADDATVTERQEESPGTLTGSASVDERLADLIDRMRAHHDFVSSLDDETLLSIAQRVYEDESDEELATSVDASVDEIRRARFDLHLVMDDDRDFDVPFEELRRAVAEGATAADLMTAFDLDRATAERAMTVLEAEREMRRTNYRFRDEFDELLADGDVEEQLSDAVTDDGLADATEGLEVNTSF